MLLHLRILCFMAPFACLFISTAATANSDRIRAVLSERLPGLPPIDSVVPSVVPGIWEVRIGTVVFYTDAEAEHMIQGEIRETKTQRNLTRARVDEASAVSFKELPFADSLTIRVGNGEREIAIFSDPQCGYCKALEKELAKLENVTIHLFPVALQGPESLKLATSLMCSKSPEASWRAWMAKGVKPRKATCEALAVKRNSALANRHRVTGTPSILFADGTRSEGMIEAKQLSEKIALVAARH